MTTITALPTPPQRSDPANFPARGDAFMNALPTFGTECNAVAGEINTNASAAVSSASAASTSASAAAASASAAATGSGAAKWVSGTTYAQGIVTWSPADFRSYRRIVAGAGTTDPSSDATNWLLVSVGPLPVMIVRDQKTSGSVATTGTVGTNQRDLNTVVVNSISGASLSTNAVTLPAGTYLFSGSSPTTYNGAFQASLVNTTDSITYAGTSEYGSYNRSYVSGSFTITSPKVFLMYLWQGGTAPMGQQTSSGLPEVYTVVEFRKIN